MGFYTVHGKEDDKLEDKILEMGPYQANFIATPHIAFGKGVCGTSWKEKKIRV